jgi:hypothetical protein
VVPGASKLWDHIARKPAQLREANLSFEQMEAAFPVIAVVYLLAKVGVV